MQRRLAHAIGNFEQRKKTKDTYIPGVLGFLINGEKTVEVANRPGYVYVRLRNNINELIQAFNDKVSPTYDLPILVVRDDVDKNRYRIYGRDTGKYENWQSSASFLPRHGNTHSFSPETGGAGDVVFVYGRQFIPLSITPSGSSGAGDVLVQPGVMYQGNAFHYAGGTGTINLLSFKPTDNTARMLLVYADAYGNPHVTGSSTYFSASITGTSAVLPYVPTAPNGTDIPLGAVRLVSGTSTILWDNIYDLRPLIVGDGLAVAPAPNSSSYLTLGLDAGLSQERVLTAGAGIQFADSGANGTLTVSVTGSLGGGGGGGGGLAIFDDNAFVVTGTAAVFNNNVRVSTTGSFAYIDNVLLENTIVTGGFSGPASSSSVRRVSTEITTAFPLWVNAFVIDIRVTGSYRLSFSAGQSTDILKGLVESQEITGAGTSHPTIFLPASGSFMLYPGVYWVQLATVDAKDVAWNVTNSTFAQGCELFSMMHTVLTGANPALAVLNNDIHLPVKIVARKGQYL